MVNKDSILHKVLTRQKFTLLFGCLLKTRILCRFWLITLLSRSSLSGPMGSIEISVNVFIEFSDNSFVKILFEPSTSCVRDQYFATYPPDTGNRPGSFSDQKSRCNDLSHSLYHQFNLHRTENSPVQAVDYT